MQGLPSVAEREAFIRAYAVSIGIDPDVAVKVARKEGLRENTWQSDLQQPYGREASYGDFQLHVDPTGKRPGLGNTFEATTNMKASNPANWQAMNRFALDQVRKQGWGPWMGAAAADVHGFDGVGGQPSAQPPAPPVQGAGNSMGGYAEGPSAVAARMPNGGLLEPDENPMQAGDMWTGYGDKWAALGKATTQLSDLYGREEEAPVLPPLPVLQPLRRFTLGKGILG
jgi:hypothetical protein